MKLLVFLTLLLALPAFAQNLNNASVTPEVVIPFMKPPQIDGVIAPGEWNTLRQSRFVSQGRDLLIERPGEFWIGSDEKRLFIAVKSAVHPDAGILAKQKPQGETDIGDVIYDDSIELWIDNAPGQNAGQFFQVMVNSNGALYDASYDGREKIAQKFWRAKLEQAHGVENGFWTAEFAFDLKDLGISDPTKPLAVRVARNFKHPWNQARWEPLVRAFEAAETMGKVRFSASAPVVSELGVQDAEGVNIGVEISNPGAASLPLKVKIGANAQDQPRYFQNWDATLAPGQSQKFELKKPFFTPGNYPQLGEVLVTDAAGATLYHRDFKWETAPDKAKIWDVLAPQTAEQSTQFHIAWLPSFGVLRFQTDFSGAENKADIKTARLVVLDGKNRKFGETTLSKFQNFGGESRLKLPKLPDGTFTAQLFFGGAAKPVKTATFQHQNEFV